MELTDSQFAALHEMDLRPRLIVIGEVGAGKTVVTSAALACAGRKSLIVTPSYAGSGPRHWDEELAKWAPDIAPIRMTGSKKERQHARDVFLDSDRAALLCTYSGMSTDLDELLCLDYDAIVIDEAHRLKGRTTKQAKAAMKLAKCSERLWFLTGTPVLNEAADLWPLYRCIDPKTYGSFWGWADLYLDVEERLFRGSRWPTKVINGLKPGAEAGLREELERYSVAFKREGDHEEPRQIVLSVDLSPAERRLYDSLKKHHYAETDDGQEVVSANPVSNLTRLRQLSSDWSGLIDTDELGSKASTVVELVTTGKLAREKVVILAAYKATVAALLSSLGAVATDYTGDLTDLERRQTLDEFVTNDGLRILVGTLAALGEGVDGLQYVCNNLVLLDREWNHPRNDQCIGRLHRHGQEHRVNVWHITAEGSTDQKVAEALAAKADITEALGLSGSG